MDQHYVQTVAREDPMTHELMAIDPIHYVKMDCPDPLMTEMVCVKEWNTDRVKETISEESFNYYYSEVDMSTDEDHQISVPPEAPIFTSPNGNQFAIMVDDDGSIIATLVAT